MKRKIRNHELNVKHANDIKCLGCSSLLLIRQLKTVVSRDFIEFTNTEQLSQ